MGGSEEGEEEEEDMAKEGRVGRSLRKGDRIEIF